jgi:Helicase HerA, central domain
MKPSDEFRQLDMSFVAEPPLRDARRPVAMAFRQMQDLSFVAFAGLEIQRIVIRSDSAPKEGENRFRMWTVAVEAIIRLATNREFWYVITTRRPAGPDGSTLRTGWLAVGRGGNAFEAARNCEDTLDDLRTIYGGSIEFAASAPVTEDLALLDLVRPAGAPFVRSFRRQRWIPAIYVGQAAQPPVNDAEAMGTILPWSGRTASWGPLAEALATSPSHVAFVVRVSAGISVPAEAIAAAEREFRQIGIFYEEMLGVRSRDVTMVPEGFERLLRRAGDRLLTLQGKCLAVDVSLAAWEPPNAGLSSLAAAVITSHSYGEEDHSQRNQQQESMRLETIVLDARVLLDPLDPVTTPDLLVGAREAVTLVRTIEPPEDERSPLPCSRSRILSLRHGPLGGTYLGTSEERGLTREVHLGESARFQHAYIVGQTGTGKSTLMLSLALGDIRAGHGITVLDPHGSLVQAILERMPRERIDDVVVMDSTDSHRCIGLNPLDFQTDDPIEYLSRRDQAIDELFDTFDALYDLKQTGGPVFEQYFRIFMGLLCGTRRPTDYTPILPMLTLLM